MKVGDKVTVERRFSSSRPTDTPQHRYEAEIVKITATRAYLSRTDWFALDDPRREVKPRYLDYRQTAKLGSPVE